MHQYRPQYPGQHFKCESVAILLCHDQRALGIIEDHCDNLLYTIKNSYILYSLK